jgi:hypothetical protein
MQLPLFQIECLRVLDQIGNLAFSFLAHAQRILLSHFILLWLNRSQ